MAPVPADTSASRRSFLKQAAQAISITALHQTFFAKLAFAKNPPQAPMPLAEFWSKTRGLAQKEVGITYFALDLKLHKLKNHQIWRGREGAVFLVNSHGDYSKFPLPSPVHSFYAHPIQNNIFWAVPSFDKKSYWIDVFAGKVVDELELPEHHFYGHAQILGQAPSTPLAITMYKPEDVGKGKVIFSDLKSKKISHVLATETDSFHEILHQPQQKALLVAGKNLKSAMYYEVSTETYDFKKSIALPDRAEFRHLEVLKDGKVFLTGYGDAPEKFPMNVTPVAVFDPKTDKITAVDFDPAQAGRFGGEALNTIFSDDQKRAFISNPYKGSVYEIDVPSMKLIRVIERDLVKSFRKIGSQYLSMGVSKDNTYSSYFLSSDIQQLNRGEILVDPRPSGFSSHLYKVIV